MRALRWIAIAIALAAIWDPVIRASRAQGPSIDVMVAVAERRASVAADVQRQVQHQLAAQGFDVDTGEPPVARVIVADRAPAGLTADVPVWAIDMSERSSPNVSIRKATASPARIPGQSVEVRVVVDGLGVKGDTTELRLEQQGIPVASARHVWNEPTESWTTALRYLPGEDSASAMSVRAVPLRRETTAADNVMDVRLPRQQPAVRVLVYDGSVSWPALFVRRSLEGEPAFVLDAMQRTSQGVVTQAGSPPATLSTSRLSRYDVIVVGGPETLTERDVETLRWFVEERGGIVAFVPDRAPSGRYASLVAAKSFDARALEQPVAVDAGATRLQSSELLVARRLPSSARSLATVGRAAEPVVFITRRGAGAVIFSGALDAWRYRAADGQAFARFWRRILTEAALTVPPRLAVEVEPSLARIGEIARIRARLRATEMRLGGEEAASPPIAARVIGPDQHVDTVVRLWPTVEPGVFEGQWTVPAAGEYDVSVSCGDAKADASFAAFAQLARGADDDREGLIFLTRVSGGERRTSDQIADLVSTMRSRFPPRSAQAQVHPMRSPWWVLAFAAALCAEWGWRRAHGAR